MSGEVGLPNEGAHTQTIIHWRVESETTEDEFGPDEAGAREWLAEIQRKVRDGEPHWEPAQLMRRSVTITTDQWEVVTPPTGPTSPVMPSGGAS